MISEPTSEAPHAQDPPPAGVASDSHGIVIDSVGRADAGIIRVLRSVRPGPAADVAKLVYQAPSELLRGVSEATANDVARALEDAGLEIRVVDEGTRVEQGRGEWEVALRIDDVGAIPQIIREVASLLGLDVDAARRLVCATPAVILGEVSTATVDAVKRRFNDLPVSLRTSKTEDADFYVVVASSSATVLASVYEIMLHHVPSSAIQRGRDTVTVVGLSSAEATGLWDALRRTGATTTVCNLDFEQYDISLDCGPQSPELGALLEELGIPAGLIPRVLQNLPVVIAQDVGHEDMISIVDRISRLGGSATATPHTTNRFSVVVDRSPNPTRAARVLEELGGMSPAAALEAFSNGEGRAFGSFTKTTALWLRRELLAAGARVHLEVR